MFLRQSQARPPLPIPPRSPTTTTTTTAQTQGPALKAAQVLRWPRLRLLSPGTSAFRKPGARAQALQQPPKTCQLCL